MKEAFRLLSKSIIRVETPDINLEEEPDVPETTGLIHIFIITFDPSFQFDFSFLISCPIIVKSRILLP